MAGRLKISGALATAAAVLVAAAGCGGGGGTGGGAEQPTKAAFVKQGDAICAKAESKKNEAIKVAFNEQQKAGRSLDRSLEVELVEEVALPPIAAMVEQLAELPLPSEGEEEAAAMVAAYREVVERIEADPTAALQGAPFAAADRLAKQLGFSACAEI